MALIISTEIDLSTGTVLGHTALVWCRVASSPTDLHGCNGNGHGRKKGGLVVLLLHGGVTQSIIGGFYQSYNGLGYGFLEQVCIGALVIELERRCHRVEREVAIPVHYDGAIVGTYRADLVVDNKVCVEVKSEAGLTGIHVRQLRNYLSGTEFEVGLVVVYGLQPQFKRIILTNDRKKLRPDPWQVPSHP